MEEGQAVAQPALGAMNPHEAVAYLADAIEEAEKQPARDPQGKFAKPATEEAQPAAEASEEPAEEASPEESEAPQEDVQEEAQPEPRKLKLKYKGEEKEVDESEAVELAQKGYDYSQKTAALAQERAELAAKAKAAEDAARAKYESQLQTYEQIVLKLADQEALTADLAKVAQEDPAKALQLSIKRSQIAETIQAVHAEQQKLIAERQAQQSEAVQKQAREAVEKLKERIPGWSNDLYGKILKGSEQYGYSSQELNAITDHRAIEVLNDALKWREYQSAKPKTVDKRVASVPKVAKPGTAEKPNPSAKKLSDGMARLAKTGSREDAHAYALSLIESGRV